MKRTEQRTENRAGRAKEAKTRAYISIVLLLLALAALTAATAAWFTIADNTRVNTMGLDIVADVDLRMDLDPHDTIDQYRKTLSFEEIAQRIEKEKGFSMKEVPLEPVTTSDCVTFTFENGKTVPDTSGAYLEFTLHFMAEKDMTVHLTSASSSEQAQDGTEVSSKNSELPGAMRISFAADDHTWIYSPGMEDERKEQQGMELFGLPAAERMTLSDRNALFDLKQGVDKPVAVRIWLEGTDGACTDRLQSADYSIRLRFTGETAEK